MFIDRPTTYFNTVEQKIWDYFDTNQDFFQSQGYKKYDPRLSLGSIVVGKIKNLDSKETILEKVSQHQTLKSINFAKIL
jgi:hypothetical protein